MTTARGPMARIARAAAGRLAWPDELARLLVVEEEHVDPLEQAQQLGALALDPEVHGVAGDEAAVSSPARAPTSCSTGSMLARKTNSELAHAGGSFGRKSGNTLSCVSSVVRVEKSGA